MSLSDDLHRGANSIVEAVEDLAEQQKDFRAFARDLNMRVMNLETNLSAFRAEANRKLDLLIRKLTTNGEGADQL